MINRFKQSTHNARKSPINHEARVKAYADFLASRKPMSGIRGVLLLPFRMIRFAFRVLALLFDFLETSLLLVTLVGFMLGLAVLAIYMLIRGLPFAIAIFMSLFH